MQLNICYSKRVFLFFFFFIFINVTSYGVGYFRWTELARVTYEKVMSLELDEAEKQLEILRLKEPENLMIYHLENYIDFFRVFINEDFEEFKLLEKKRNLRLQKIRCGDPYSPYNLYLQADIRLQWAFVRLKFEEYATAFFETNKAFKLLEENRNKYPNFMPNYKNLGILHAMVGTIPDNYKWLVESLTAMTGNMHQGKEELQRVISFSQKNDFIYEEETYAYYSYLLLHLGNEEKSAWQLMKQSNLNPKKSLLATFVMANLAMRTCKNDLAIKLLENRPQGQQYHTFYYLDYMLGSAKLSRLDSDANIYLQKFISNFKGRNFLKDAQRKLAWAALLKTDTSGYLTAIEKVDQIGYTVVGNDQSAQGEYDRAIMPHKYLLKTRVLYDGGYIESAKNVIDELHPAEFKVEEYQIEYYYRKGRIEQELGNYYEAMEAFQKTISLGENKPFYYACKAALETGKILEGLGKYTQAIIAFRNCLSIKPKEHRTGLHQAAKSGIFRCNRNL